MMITARLFLNDNQKLFITTQRFLSSQISEIYWKNENLIIFIDFLFWSRFWCCDILCCLPAHNSDANEAGRIITLTEVFHKFTRIFLQSSSTQFTSNSLFTKSFLSTIFLFSLRYSFHKTFHSKFFAAIFFFVL